VIFADLAVGESVFLDANPLVYHFAPDPQFGAACSELIGRIENQELHGFTSTHVLSEMAHKLMTLEAANAFGWSSKVVNRLRRDPNAVMQLGTFQQAVEKVPQLGIDVLTIPPSLIETATRISKQSGLLCNDALLVAVMQANGLTHLASNDGDFDRVPGVTRYGPV
jgi:hypothetical protein